jgi:hypothetical protein
LPLAKASPLGLKREHVDERLAKASRILKERQQRWRHALGLLD